jgi:hypothetical protein
MKVPGFKVVRDDTQIICDSCNTLLGGDGKEHIFQNFCRRKKPIKVRTVELEQRRPMRKRKRVGQPHPKEEGGR